MKSLLIIFSFISVLSYGQEFLLTQDNFKSKSDDSKNFVVIDLPDKTQKELFDKTKMHIHSNYSNLKGDGYNEVEYSQIKIVYTTIIDTGRRLLGMSVTKPYISAYEIGFKDGKVMIKPQFVEINNDDKYNNKIYLTSATSLMGKSIFKKNGSIQLKELHKAAEDSTNEFVEKLIKSLKEDSTSDW